MKNIWSAVGNRVSSPTAQFQLFHHQMGLRGSQLPPQAVGQGVQRADPNPPPADSQSRPGTLDQPAIVVERGDQVHLSLSIPGVFPRIAAAPLPVPRRPSAADAVPRLAAGERS